MKTLIVYFSWTGSVARLADQVRLHLQPFGEVVEERIEPVKEHGYWGWLTRSFLPGCRVTVRPPGTGLCHFDLVCLGFPKWTLGCPPVNEYCASMRVIPGQKVGLFMSYGGFDGRRYMRSLAKTVTEKGARIVATASIKRSAMRDGTYTDTIERFCRELLTPE